MKPELIATITPDFELEFAIPRMRKAVLAGIGAGEKVRVDYRKWYKKRTEYQNNTIWGPDYALILAYIQKTTGQSFTPEALHEWHKREFLGFTESVEHKGLYEVKSTKGLDTKGFADFREDYCRYWAEHGLYIPDPDPEKSTKRPRKK